MTLRDLEYDFARRHIVGEELSIIDVGGCDARLGLQLAQAGHVITVCDYREYPEKHPNLTSIQGDFLQNQLPDNSFDYVLFISTIEHIGFGSYGAPAVSDGDLTAFAEAKRLLKRNGRIVITFPFAGKETYVSGFERWYDVDRARRLFEGMYVMAEEYYAPATRKQVRGRVINWSPVSLDQITSEEDVVKAFGRQCNACYALSRQPRAHFA